MDQKETHTEANLLRIVFIGILLLMSLMINDNQSAHGSNNTSQVEIISELHVTLASAILEIPSTPPRFSFAWITCQIYSRNYNLDSNFHFQTANKKVNIEFYASSLRYLSFKANLPNSAVKLKHFFHRKKDHPAIS